MTKRQRSTRRRQRAKAKVNCAIDFETHFGQADFIMGDYHIGTLALNGPSRDNAQLMAYARLCGLDEVFVLHGGDLIHHTKKLR